MDNVCPCFEYLMRCIIYICRVNEQMDLTITHTLWMREHNRYKSCQPIVPSPEPKDIRVVIVRDMRNIL